MTTTASDQFGSRDHCLFTFFISSFLVQFQIKIKEKYYYTIWLVSELRNSKLQNKNGANKCKIKNFLVEISDTVKMM